MNLPPLHLDEAQDVEEALIAHFGPANATPNPWAPTHSLTPGLPPITAGQLSNKRHEISPISLGYCDRLLKGQMILVTHSDPKGNPYARVAPEFFTFPTRCPGVNGPR